MHEPDNYGLSETQTLLQVADATPPSGFVHFWAQWGQRVWAGEPVLESYEYADTGPNPGCAGVTHTFKSVGDVRIGARLILPEAGVKPRAIVVTTHGYGMSRSEPLDDQNPWSERGLAVLKIRVRGYPGSQLDAGDLISHELGYATIGLNDRSTWILASAVADVVNGLRAARQYSEGSIPIMLHGESFGGGLAIVAASELAGRFPIARMVVALPSLGWWLWRLDRRPHAGIGFEIRRFIDSHRGSEPEVQQTLRLLDAVVHARRVTCPLLCKVAERDDVVPAPTAAAVYNACGTDPGLKWRFVTRYGHHEGGLADVRRHAMFERLSGAFLDPAVDLQELMRRWESSLLQGERPPESL